MATLRFSAPASSANLGPAFDCMGLALELRNELRATTGTGQITIEGEGAQTLPTDHTNLVARAFDRAAPGELRGWDLHCTNRVPTARGLGSSTAAAALGLIAGWACTDQRWDANDLFELLAELDGHPDNAAACAHGGFVLTFAHADGELEALPLGPADWLAPLVAVPDREVATSDARAALPTTYSRADVARAIGSAAALATGLIAADVELLADVLGVDIVHEPHRAELVPELADIRSCLHSTRALGATLSGAGPSVLVWCEPDTRVQALGSLQIDFPDLRLLPLDIAPSGARVEA